MTTRRFLTTVDLMEAYRFPSRHAVRQFLAYHATEITVHKRGRVVLVEEREFDAFMRRERRLQLRSGRAQLNRQAVDAGGEFQDVHADEPTDSVGLAHPKPFGVTA